MKTNTSYWALFTEQGFTFEIHIFKQGFKRVIRINEHDLMNAITH